MKYRPFLLCGILFVIFWCSFFGSTLFGDQVYFSHDIKTFYYPYRAFVAEKIAQGIVPLWSRLSSAGFPVHGAAEMGVLYPPNRLLFYLLPPLTAFTWLLLGHYFLAGMSVILLQKERGVSAAPALLSGLTYTFSGFMITHLFHVSIIQAAAWFPLLLLFIVRWLKTGRGGHLLAASLIVFLEFLVAHPQIAIISCFAATLYLFFDLIPGDAAQRTSVTARCSGVCIFLFLGFGLSLAQIVPTYEASLFTVRGFEAAPAFHFQGSLQPQMLITLIFPLFFGIVRPSEVQGYGYVSPLYWGQGGAFWEMCGYVGIICLILSLFVWVSAEQRKRSLPFCLLGLSGLLLALGKWGILYYLFHYFPGASQLRFPSRFLMVWTLSIAVLAGDGFNFLLRTRREKNTLKIWRILTLTTLGFLVATVGLHYLVQSNQHFFSETGYGWVDRHLLSRDGHLLSKGRYYQKIDQNITGFIEATDLRESDCYKPFVIIFLFILLGLNWQRKTTKYKSFLVLGVFLLWLVDLGLFSYTYNRTTSSQTALTKPESVSFLERDTGLYRIVSLDRKGFQENELLKPCFNVLFGVPSLFTPGPMMAHNFHQWLRETGTGLVPFDFIEKQQIFLQRLRMVSLLNIKYILTEHALRHHPQLELVHQNQIFIYRNESVLPRFMLVPHFVSVPSVFSGNIPEYLAQQNFDFRSTVVLDRNVSLSPRTKPFPTQDMNTGAISVEYYDDHAFAVQVEARLPCLLRVTDRYYPGWLASVDAAKIPIYQAEGLFRAVSIKPGSQKVTFTFQPFSFKIGLFGSLIFLKLIIILCVGRIIR